ncbi:hypothetical protein KKC91_10520 [bacterium]|nr:hypothetical protein [bacterium]
MNSRERVLGAIKFKNPDNIPIHHSAMPGFIDRYGEKAEKLFFRFPSDFAGQDGRYSGSEALSGHHKGGEDVWGCVWMKPAEGYSEGEVIKHPLDNWNKLKDYVFPDLTPSSKHIESIKKRIREEKNSKNPRYISVGFGDARTWERYHFLRGFTNALIDIAEDASNMYELLNKIAEINIKALEPILELDIDGVSTMDDWGTQNSLMINPASWRKIFKPIYKKYINLAHQAGKHVRFHSDGNTLQIIDDYIEIGLDVYNPQFSSIDLDKLGEKVKGKMCICSDIDRQYILPRGKPDEVKEYVEKVIQIFSNKGGLIGRGELGPDVPLENAEAMLRTFFNHI